VARVANNDNKLFKLELNFNTEKQIFEGTTAEVIVELNPIENIIKVPSSALIIKENSLFVKYLNEESKVKELKVKIIDEDKDGLYVLIQDHIDAASLSIITLGALEVDNVEIVEHQSEL
jgi:multidrug efflux pump subunit AcrA (membrane-fusion protein)